MCVCQLPVSSQVTQLGTGDKGSGNNQFYWPRHVTIMADGGGGGVVFVSDADNHRIQVLDVRTGTYMRTIGKGEGKGEGQLQWPSCTALYRPTATSPPLLYVSDYDNHRVVAHNITSGEYMHTLVGGEGSAPRQLKSPIGLLLVEGREWGVEGEVLVIAEGGNNRLQLVHATTGAHIRFMGEGHLRSPNYLALLVQGPACSSPPCICVGEWGADRVSIFNMQGDVVQVVGGEKGSLPGQLNGVRGVAVSGGAVPLLYVSDYLNKRVQIYDPTSGAHKGVLPGTYNRPYGLTIHPSTEGNLLLYVVEWGGNKVTVVKL